MNKNFNMNKLSKMILKFFSWKVNTNIPSVNKYILVAAPHTTNWDFPLMILTSQILNIKIFWMGIKSLFFWPLKNVMLKLGGIPIDRSKQNSLVGQLSERIHNSDKFVLVIPPEGTRSRTKHWKSGFIHIAKSAKIPIILCYLDYKTKETGFSVPIDSKQDPAKIMEIAKKFYKDVTPLYPKNFGPISLKKEE